jgi:hypothetical protein
MDGTEGHCVNWNKSNTNTTLSHLNIKPKRLIPIEAESKMMAARAWGKESGCGDVGSKVQISVNSI